MPVAGLALPQVLLGAESQLLAYAADVKEAWFAPFPEMFCSGDRLPPAATHVRFGGVRSVRVLKGARNVCVLAEQAGPALLTASHHPFASGRVVPAAVEEVHGLCPGVVEVTRLGGGTLACGLLPAGLAVRYLPSARQLAAKGLAGLEMACLADFQSDAWAAGTAALAMPPAGERCVLLPWNMDHPGSIVPLLLERLARLSGEVPVIILLPFNYIGQTGIIRDLIERLAAAADPAGGGLANMFIARVRALEGVAPLRRLARVAWVDGNDPEHWWTVARLEACGISTLLLEAGQSAHVQPAARLAADEAVWVEAETRCGALTFSARLPSLRALPELLALTDQWRAPRRRSA